MVRNITASLSSVAILIFIAVGVCSAPAHASALRVKSTLTPTTISPRASGLALTIVRNTQGRFRVKARHLAPNATYQLVVKGVPVAMMTTNGGGSAKVRFRSQPDAKNLPLGFDPRGGTVSLVDENGEEVLQGDIDDDSVDADAVRCCLAQNDDENEDDGNAASANEQDETECEQLTAAACTAAGGTNLGSGTCMPDPCEAITTTQGEQVVCCVPDADPDDEAECEHRTEADCAKVQGISLGAGSCDPNPCEVTPPPTTTRCCEPDDEGTQCEHRTAAQCTARGGTDMGPGMCTNDLCAGAPSDAIRCCVEDDNEAECEVSTAAACSAQGGQNLGPGSCDPNPCTTPPNGDEIRCCEPDDDGQECEHRTADECALRGGIDKGPGLCEPNPCDGGSNEDDD